jgi:hypothetical protein
MESYHGTHTPLSNYISERWGRQAQGCLQRKLQRHPYNPFALCEEYKSVQCGIKVKGMKTYHDNLRNIENTGLRFIRVINGNGVQKLMASMPDNRALREWELRTLEDMRCNDNH